MNKKIFLIFISICSIILLAKDKITLPRNNTHLREGPGCYYPITKILNSGAEVDQLDKEKGWLKVKWNNKVGWISSNVLKESPDKKIIDQKVEESENSNISQASLSGAIRGFAEKYIAQTEGNSDFIQKYDRKIITPEGYLSFKKNTYHNRNPKKLSQRYTLPEKESIPHINIQDEKLGLAIASRIAQKEIVGDSEQRKYINYIATLISEQSSFYHYPIRVYIVKEDRKAAYSTPSGYIFISTGLMQQINNEAELASLLGHELAHIIQKHGRQELEKRETRITAQNAFRELQQETSQADTSGSNLESLANQLYEAACARRQLKYEYEADRLGVIYAYKAGYDPNSYIRLLKRISGNADINYQKFESEWESFYLKQRRKKINKFTSDKLDKQNNLDVVNKMRFQEYIPY